MVGTLCIKLKQANFMWQANTTLNHFQPMFHFYTPRKHQKTSGFLIFSGGIEVEHWLKLGEENKIPRSFP